MGVVFSIFDRVKGYFLAKFNARSILRMLLVEATYNTSILSIALREYEDSNDVDVLWQCARLLKSEVIYSLLSVGADTQQAFKELANIKFENDSKEGVENDSKEGEGDDLNLINESGGLLASIYVRISVISALSRLDENNKLQRIRIRVRTQNLHRDLNTVRQVLRVMLSETGGNKRT